MAFRIRSSFFLFPFFFPPQQRRTREVKKQWAYDPNPPPSFRSSTESLFAPLSPFFLSCPLLFAVSCPPPFPLSLFASFIPASSLAHHPSLIEFLCTPVARVSSRLASRASCLVSRARAQCNSGMHCGSASADAKPIPTTTDGSLHETFHSLFLLKFFPIYIFDMY